MTVQGVRVKENEEVRQRFFNEAVQPNSLNNISAEVSCYRGHRKNPEWMDLEPGECPSSTAPQAEP